MKIKEITCQNICKIFVSEKKSEYMLVGLTQWVISQKVVKTLVNGSARHYNKLCSGYLGGGAEPRKKVKSLGIGWVSGGNLRSNLRDNMTEYMSVCLCQKKLEYILVGGGHPK